MAAKKALENLVHKPSIHNAHEGGLQLMDCVHSLKLLTTIFYHNCETFVSILLKKIRHFSTNGP